MSKTAKLAIAIIVIALGAFAIYSYAVRPTKAPTETANEETGTATDSAFHFDTKKTVASFTLNEVLRGTPTVVVGTTSDMSGSFTADRQALASAQLSEIKINARTFVTDSEQRNNAIRRFILKTEDDANEFIVFKPTEIKGLPEHANLGQSITFQISGDLTIAGVTKPVTFTGVMSFTTDNTLEGKAQTTVHYPDFGITVPDLPFLANVDKDTLLKIDFTATKN